jgi:hypothetical protein
VSVNKRKIDMTSSILFAASILITCFEQRIYNVNVMSIWCMYNG